MPFTKGCGRITTSWMPMWCKPSLAALAMLLALAVSAHAQSLADRIQSGDRRAALAMIADGADVNQAQPDGTTPLHWAVYRIDRELVGALLRKGARADAVNRYGEIGRAHV